MQQTGPHNPITGKENSFVKRLRSLTDPKHRKKERAFLIEGVKMVEEALRDDLGVITVVAAPSLVHRYGKGILNLAQKRSVEVFWISDRLMDTLSESKTPQPLMAVVRMKTSDEQQLLSREAGIIVIAHQLQDPGNLGTIIRTAEAAGAAGVAITANTVDPFNAKSVRASMNSILRLPVVYIDNISDFLKRSRTKGFLAAATTLTGEITHFDIDFTKRMVIILGKEGSGLTQDILENIDLRIRIPMAGAIDSLNVAAAAAIILYEAMRQRSQ